MIAKESIDSIKRYLLEILSMTRGSLPQPYTAEAILLFVIIRRMECLYEPYRKKVLSIYNKYKDQLDVYDMDTKIRESLGKELGYYILSPYTMYDLLMQGYFKGAAGMEHYIRSFDPRTAEQLLKYGAIDYSNRLLYAKTFATILGRISALSLDLSISREGFEEIVSWLIPISAAGGRAASISYSTNELSKIMASVLLSEGKIAKRATLYDPVCGSGNLLRVVQSQSQQPMSVYGQEIIERMASLNGLLAKTSIIDDFQFASGDVLEEDKFYRQQFDYIVADPPMRQRIEDCVLFDISRFPMGIPTNHDATGLFIQHIILKMAPKGRAVFTCVPSFFSEEHSTSDRLRSWMLKQDIIESIISLPSGFVSGTNMKICLCVLNKNKSKQRKGYVQIINAESLFPRQKMRVVLTDESLEKIVSVYRSFENNVFCHIAQTLDFFRHEVDVKQPARDNEGSLILVNGRKVADSKKTVPVAIPKDNRYWEDYIYRNVISHLDKDSWIDQTSVRVKCKIDINTPFDKQAERRSVQEIKRDVSKLSGSIISLFDTLFIENKNNRPVYSPEDFHPMQALFGSLTRITRSRTPLVRIGKKSKYPVLSPDYLRGYISEPSEYVESVADDQIVNDGDILILMDGENAGEVFRGKQGCLSRTMVKVESTTPAFDKDYLYYLLKAKEPDLRLKTRGEYIKHLSLADLRSLRIVVPSISHQITMARSLNPKIEAIDKLISMLGGNARETIVEYRQALIQDAIASVTPVMN